MKIYRVELTLVYYAFTETEKDAKDCKHEVLADASPSHFTADARSVTRSEDADWDEDSLLFHHGTEDITFREALRRMEREAAR